MPSVPPTEQMELYMVLRAVLPYGVSKLNCVRSVPVAARRSPFVRAPGKQNTMNANATIQSGKQEKKIFIQLNHRRRFRQRVSICAISFLIPKLLSKEALVQMTISQGPLMC